jgi:hypothetical protein
MNFRLSRIHRVALLAGMFVVGVIIFAQYISSPYSFISQKEKSQPVQANEAKKESALVGTIGDVPAPPPRKEPTIIDGDALSVQERKKIPLKDKDGNPILVKGSVLRRFDATIIGRDGMRIKIQNTGEKYQPISEQYIEVQEQTEIVAREKNMEANQTSVTTAKGALEEITIGMKVTITTRDDLLKDTFNVERIEYLRN